MSNFTERELRIFELGKKQGREEVIAEIHKALGIDELVAKAIHRHEEQNHDGQG